MSDAGPGPDLTFDPNGTAIVEARKSDGGTWWSTTVLSNGGYEESWNQLQSNAIQFGFDRCDNVLIKLGPDAPWLRADHPTDPPGPDMIMRSL